jgi:manganese-dependent ADP-ribose/CDP-alcohol diphosphatase
LACIVNLGDIIDGVNDDDVTVEVPTRVGPVPEELAAKNRVDLAKMAAIVRRGAGAIPVYHCLGNHDLNLPREEVTKTLGNPGAAAYFTVKLPRRWRLIVLDTTEVNPRYLDPGSVGLYKLNSVDP